MSCLAGMSKLVVLQLKAITNPPGETNILDVVFFVAVLLDRIVFEIARRPACKLLGWHE